MPELPDIEVFAKNLDRKFAGKKVLRVKILPGSKKIEGGTAKFMKRLKGRVLTRIYRSGKEMRFLFDNETLLGLHLMLTGDLFIFQKKNEHPFARAEIYFNGGYSLVLCDRMRNAYISLDPIDKAGIDALSPSLNAAYLLKLLKRKTQIKKLLINQELIRGIGNSYSDEILWEARISPYSVAEKIPAGKVAELAPIIKRRLRKEIKLIDKNYPGKINQEVKDFMMIHSSKKTESPTGCPIITDKNGLMKTYYTKEQVLYK